MFGEGTQEFRVGVWEWVGKMLWRGERRDEDTGV